MLAIFCCLPWLEGKLHLKELLGVTTLFCFSPWPFHRLIPWLYYNGYSARNHLSRTQLKELEIGSEEPDLKLSSEKILEPNRFIL